MIRRLSLAMLAISSPLMLLTFLVPVPFGDAVFALLAAVFPVALMMLGAQRAGRVPKVLSLLFALLGGFLVLCMAALLLLRGGLEEGPWLGGLPLAAAIELYGLFLVPLPIVIYAYAATFDRFALRDEDLTDLRRRFGGGER